MSDSLLEVSNLKVGYGDLTAVWDVSLTARPGRTCALVGRNGAGKSTFLSGVAGLLPIQGGEILFRGESVTTVPAHLRAKAGIVLVQEGKRVFRSMTVGENLRLGFFARDRSDGVSEADVLEQIFERFPALRDRTRAAAGSLSGGQQQMLAIAQAVIANPSVLMLDEPSSGLAPIVVDEVLAIVDALRKDGFAIVLVEQLLEDVLSGIADDVVLIEQGRLVLADEAKNIQLDQLIEATTHAG